MPISHKYKLIFIHIPKCAGISIWKCLDLTEDEDNLISFTQPVLQHLLPKQLKGKYINTKTWDSYKKFTIIRNPYDRVVSDYFWMKEHAPHLAQNDFDDYLSLREDVVKNNKYDLDMYFDHFYPMHYYFEDIKYDHVIRFENIEVEFEKIRNLYNIENILTKNNQSSSKGYLLSEEQEERIYSLYKNDFIKFGYKKQTANNANKNNTLSELNKSIKTIEEKIILINKLETKLKNTQNISLDKNNSISNIKTLYCAQREISIQFFWKSTFTQFSEETSVSNIILLSEDVSVNSFEIPHNFNQLNAIRFDIDNKIGFVNIHDIKIKNKKQKNIWEWDKYALSHKKNLFLIENNKLWNGRTIQLATSDDPQLIFEINEPKNYDDVDSFTIELSLSAIDENQKRQINELSTLPLSFITEKQFHEQEIIIDNLILEKESVLSEISNERAITSSLNQEKSSLLSQLKDLNSEKLLYSKNIVTTDLLIHQLSEDKKHLTSEIFSKNELLNKISIDNENLILSKEEIMNKNVIEKTIIDHLKKENELKDVFIAELNNNKNLYINELNEKNNIINKLIFEKSTIEGLISDLSLKFHSVENKTFELLQDNLKAKDDLTVRIISLEKEISYLQSTNKNKNEEIEDKISTIVQLNNSIEIYNNEKKHMISTLEKQQDMINIISNDKIELQNNYDNSLVQLNSLKTILKSLQDELSQKTELNTKQIQTIEKLNENILEIRETYEKKNIFQIIYNRIFEIKPLWTESP